jgi:acetyl-CoA synthetase
MAVSQKRDRRGKPPSRKGPTRQSTSQADAHGDHYQAIVQSFGWQVPEWFNMAEVCCRRWAADSSASKKIAIYEDGTGVPPRFYTYGELAAEANRLSRVLSKQGVSPGDRVAIVMPQRFETAVAYMAVLQMGAVAMPLSMLFGPEALAFRLQDSGACVALVDESSSANLGAVHTGCPQLRQVLAWGVPAPESWLDAASLMQAELPSFEAVKTRAQDPAILIYTSGTTGNPKGALLPHRALIGNLTGFICSQNWFGFDPHKSCNTGLPMPKTHSVFWSPADWAWTGGLMDALLPTLYFGRPIVAFNGRFSPQMAFELMQNYGVTHTFLFPTALKAMMKAYPRPAQHFKLKLQAMMSAGEAVGDAVFDYCRTQLGITVNEMFGQTEINYIVGNCSLFWPARAGSMGKGYPGHRVAVIHEDGQECAVGVAGDVALHRLDARGQPDPIFFLGYWKNEAATRAKFTGSLGPDDWCRTGDLATRDADGYLWYQGRADDVFKAAGYRIGPGEIENCLVKHPAVANAAVVPKPDAERGALVKAYIVLAPEFEAKYSIMEKGKAEFEENLVAQLQAHVKGKLAPYEYPKEIEFVPALPMTTTGKVQRRVLRLQEEERASQRSNARDRI